jgi:hypothetical protein
MLPRGGGCGGSPPDAVRDSSESRDETTPPSGRNRLMVSASPSDRGLETAAETAGAGDAWARRRSWTSTTSDAAGADAVVISVEARQRKRKLDWVCDEFELMITVVTR